MLNISIKVATENWDKVVKQMAIAIADKLLINLYENNNL